MATNLRDRGYSSSMDNYNLQLKKQEEQKRKQRTVQNSLAQRKKVESQQGPISTRRAQTSQQKIGATTTGRAAGSYSPERARFESSPTLKRSYGTYDNWINGRRTTAGGYYSSTKTDTNLLQGQLGRLDRMEAAYPEIMSRLSAELKPKQDALDKYNRTVRNYTDPRQFTPEIKAEGDALWADYQTTVGKIDNFLNAYQQAGLNAQKTYAAYDKENRDRLANLRDKEVVRADIDARKKEMADRQQEKQDLEKSVNAYARMAATPGLNEQQKAQIISNMMNAQDKIKRLDMILENDSQDIALLYEEWELSNYQYWKGFAEQKLPDSVRRADNKQSLTEQQEDYRLRFNQAVETGSGIRSRAREGLNRMDSDAAMTAYLSPEERRIYDALAEQQGVDYANQYFDDLRKMSLNTRRRISEENAIREAVESDPIGIGTVGMNAMSVLLKPYQSLTFLAQTIDQFNGDGMTKDAAYNRAVYMNNAVRNATGQRLSDAAEKQFGKNWGKWANFAYQTGMSMADFLYNAKLTGALTGGGSAAASESAKKAAEQFSLLLMSSEAAADSTMQAMDRGLSSGQAYALGFIGGLAEYVTERVSLETLLDMVKTSGGVKEKLWYLLKNRLAEASEEGASDMINLFADILITKDQSQWAQAVGAYMQKGMSKEEATRRAILDQAEETGMSMLGGWVSGGTMSNVMLAMNEYRTVTSPEYINENVFGPASRLKKGNAVEQAQALQQKLQNGERIGPRDVRRAENAIRTDRVNVRENIRQAEKYGGTEAAELAKDLRAKLKTGQDATVREANNLAKALAKEQMVDPESDHIQFILREGKASSKDSVAYKSAAALESKIEAGQRLTQNEVTNALDAVNEAVAKDLSSEEVETVGARLLTEDGQALLRSSAETLKRANREAIQARGERVLQMIEDGTIDAKTAGETLIEAEQLKKNTVAQMKKSPVKLQPREVTEDMDDFDRKAAEIGVSVERAAKAKEYMKAFGIKGRFEALGNDAINGYYDKKTGEMVLNANSDDAFLAIVAHEVTHDLENTAGYRKFADMVFSRSKNLDADLDRIVRKYSDAGIDLDTDGNTERRDARSELVAEFVEEHMFNDEKFIRDVVDQDRSLGHRVLNWLDDMLAKLGNKNAQERQMLRHARDLWADALQQRKKSKDVQEKLAKRRGTEEAESSEEGVQNAVNQDAVIESDAFKEWFGDWENDPEHASKVVDENGRPLVLYHNTSADFWTFDLAGHGDNMKLGPGIYLTPNSAYAKKFGTRQMALYADVRRPATDTDLTLTQTDAENLIKKYVEVMAQDYNDSDLETAKRRVWDEFFADHYAHAEYGDYQKVARTMFLFNHSDMAVVQEFLQITRSFLNAENAVRTMNEVVTPVTGIDGFYNSSDDVWRVINSEQLKSATDNVGTFDRSNPDVRFSVAPGAIQSEKNNAADLDSEVDRVFEAATPVQAELNKMLRELSNNLGTKYKDVDQKSKKSMKDKVTRKHEEGRTDYTVMAMKDHARSKVDVKQWDDIPKVLDFLESKGIPYVTEAVGPTPYGYKGFHVTWRNNAGISSELQVTMPHVWEVKLQSDKIYDKWRNVSLDEMSEEARAEFEADLVRSNKMWADLQLPDFSRWDVSSSDNTVPLRNSSPDSGAAKALQLPSTNSRNSLLENSTTRPDSVRTTNALTSANSIAQKAGESKQSGPKSLTVPQADDGIQYGVKTAALTAGIDIQRDSAGRITFKLDGKNVTKIDEKHIENHSAFGAMIKLARDGVVENKNGKRTVIQPSHISPEEADKQFKAVADLMNLIMDTQNPDQVWEFAGSQLFAAVKSNSDGQYSTTVDFTTVCRKTQDMITAMSEAMMEKKGGLTKRDVVALQKKLVKQGLQVNCPVCYVFSRWAGVGTVLDNMWTFQNRYDKMSEAEIRARLEELKARDRSAERSRIRSDLKNESGEMYDKAYTDLVAGKEGLQNNNKTLRSDLRSARKNGIEAQIKQLEQAIADNKDLIDKLDKQIKEIEDAADTTAKEIVWLEKVRLQPNYKFVPADILFNMADSNAVETFVKEFPAAWKYRTSRGPALGKAIVPYADMRLGDFFKSLGTNSAATFVKSNGKKGNTFSNKESNGYARAVAGKKGTFNKSQMKDIVKAVARVRAQNLIGGQRFQSTSDFRYDYALDYIQAFFEAQAVGSTMQTYTKILEFGEMVAKFGGDVNLSVMPKNAGFVRNTGAKKLTYRDGNYTGGYLIYSNTTGVNYGGAKILSDRYDSAQLILVGINDDHIRLALNDDVHTGGNSIGFVIPYHASGASIDTFIRELVKNLGEEFKKENYTDYSKVQTDSKKSDATKRQVDNRNLRTSLLTATEERWEEVKDENNQPVYDENGDKKLKKKTIAWAPSSEDISYMQDLAKNKQDISDRSFAELLETERAALRGDPAAIREYESWSADLLWNLYEKLWTEGGTENGVRLTAKQAEAVMPHEYWDKTSTRDTAYLNGFIFRSYCFNLGLNPRFTGINTKGGAENYGDFSDCRGYWKTLIDRAMYNRDGTYRDQKQINLSALEVGMVDEKSGKAEWGDKMVPKPQPEVAKEVGREFGKLSLAKVEQKTAPKGGRQYAIKKGDTTVIVSPDYDYSKPFSQQVDDWMKRDGTFPRNDVLVVGATPEVLRKIGFTQLPMTLAQGHLADMLGVRIRNEENPNNDPRDHVFGETVTKDIMKYISDPVAVIASATHPNSSVVVVLDIGAVNGKRAIAAVKVDGTGILNGIDNDTHAITSVHGRNNTLSLLNNALNDPTGKSVFYLNERKASALTSQGLRLPRSRPAGPFINSIHDAGVSVKPRFINQTKTQQFKRWIEGSKVGAKTVPASQIYLGFNAESIDGSENYTDNSYLQIKNPLQFANQMEATRWYNENVPGYKDLQDEMYEEVGMLDELLQEVDDQMDAEGVTEEQYAELEKQHEEIEDEMDAVEDEYRGKLRDKLNDYFSKNGEYDGVIVENTGSKVVKGKKQAVASYTVFDRTQIKSATDNIGTFFPKNENYRFSVSKAQDTAYLKAVESGDMDTAQRMVDEAASNYIQQFLLPNDDDEVGFKYHRGPAPTKTFKRYAVMNVSPDGFRAAYAGNKNATPIGVWLDAQNLKSYTSDMVQFDDGTFASYIPGDTGAATNTKFSQEAQGRLQLRGGQRWLLERGGKHSSDVPNFSQMNLRQNENGEKVSSAKDGALPHNKLVFEIEYGISDNGDLTEYVRENGRMMRGKNQGLAKIQPNQYYDFKTNPNAVGNWGIGGTFRITRLVPHSEIVSVTNAYKESAVAEANRMFESGEITKKDRDARIRNANAIQVQKWVDGYHPEDFGLSEKLVADMAKQGSKMKLTDPVTYDDAGNVIPLSERFNPEKDDLRYAVKKSITEVRKEERAKFAETKQRERERRQLRELQQKTMRKLKWAKQNQFRAPKDMAADWADLVADMDTYAINVARSFTKDGKPILLKKFGQTYADVAQMAQELMDSDPMFHPSAELQKALDRVQSGHVGDFDYDGLQEYYNALTALQSEFQARNKAILGDELQDFNDIFKDAKRGMQAVKGKKDNAYFNRLLLTPTNYLKMLVGWNENNRWMDMVKDLETGERKMRDFTVRANRLLDDFKKRNKNWIAKADGQGRNGIWIEAEVPVFNWKAGDLVSAGETRTVYMTPLQRVQLYLESKGYQNMTHIANGRCFADKELYTNKKTRSQAFNNDEYRVALDPATVQDLVKDMSPEELELAEILENFYNEFSPQYINATSQRLWGYDKSIAGYYAPINVNGNYAHKEIGIGDTTAKGVGNMKVRQVKANNPTNNLSALEAFDKSVRQTAKFYGMATVERNWNMLLNWQTGDSSMRSVLDTNWRGANAPAYIQKLVSELQGNIDAPEKNIIERFVDKIISNSISATFGFNPGITMKQFGSFPTFAARLGWTTMPTAKALKVQSKAQEEIINTYTSELAYRTMGYATPETAELVQNPSILQKNKAMNFLVSGGMIIAMDAFTVRTGWAWSENYVKKNFPDLKKGTEAQIKAGESEYYKKVAEVFEDAVATTQPMYDTMHRSKIMQTNSDVVKALTMFRTVPLQLYNTARRAYGELGAATREYKADPTKENKQAKSAAAGRAATSTAAIIISNLMVEAIEFANQWFKNRGKKYRDDDDELTAASVATRIGISTLADTAGVVPIARELADIIKAKLLGDKWYGIQIPAGEYLDDIVDATKNAAQKIESFASEMSDIMSDDKDLEAFFRRKGRDYVGAIKDTIEALARFGIGLPLDNVEKYLMGAFQFSPALTAAVEDLFETPNRTNLKGKTGKELEKGVRDAFHVRGMDISDESVKEISKLFEGDNKYAIFGSAPSKLTINDEDVNLTESQTQRWERRFAKYGKEVDKLIQSKDFQNADDATKTKMLDMLYEIAENEANKTVYSRTEKGDYYWTTDKPLGENVKTITDAGGTVADAAAWFGAVAAARAKYKDVDGESLKDAEKMQILNSMSFNDALKEAIFKVEKGDKLRGKDGDLTEYGKLDWAKQNGVSVSKYLDWLDVSSGASKQEDKLAVLADSKFSEKEKLALAGTIFGKQDLKDKDGKLTQYGKLVDATESGLKVGEYLTVYSSGATSQYNTATKYGLKGKTAVDAAVKAKEALEVCEARKDYNITGSNQSWDDLSTTQKRLAACGQVLKTNKSGDPSAALIAILGDGDAESQVRDFVVAREIGISPDVYIAALTYIERADIANDGNGSYKQKEEIQVGLDNLAADYNIPRDTLAVIWQLVSNSKSHKNNPYSSSINEYTYELGESKKSSGKDSLAKGLKLPKVG